MLTKKFFLVIVIARGLTHLASERRKRVKKILLFLSICFICCHTFPVFGEEVQMNYRITADLPENQRTKDNTYFDLQITSGKKQTIAVEI